MHRDVNYKLIASAVDAKFLLLRGYSKELAFDFVAQRYSLTKEERNRLHRLVHTPDEIEMVKEKLRRPEDIRGKVIAIDGFNALITVEAGLRGHPLYICDDGMIRDIESSYGKYRLSEYTYIALSTIVNGLRNHEPSKVIFVFDEPISKSGEIAGITRNILKEYSLRGNAFTSKTTDKDVSVLGDIVISTDIVVIKRAKAVVNIIDVINVKSNFNIINLKSIICKELKLIIENLKNFM
ncbi:MAG: DUF434 domain-containing protein [Thermoprotei archaeon]|nr:MAG: DUF434 domain-containing protein [Thermoprotei archaeon]RLF19219.1 MAG: DUF434 domain-containing protein [Thermoprotei archaeon]